MKRFVFRRYLKEQGKSKKKHPKLIIDESKDEYYYLGLTSRKNKGRGHNNFKLLKNPEKGNYEPAYLRKKIENDYKYMFTEVLKNYKLSEEDKQRLVKYLEEHKKR